MAVVSVLITCYNEEKYIGKAIESVVQQTCYDAISEIIVVNDGSEDNSEHVIQQWEDRCDKLRHVHQENQGLPGARNTGIERSSGDFIALLDGDDVWLEKRLERQLSVVEEYPDVGLVYSDFYIFYDGEIDSHEKRYCNRYEYGDDNLLQRFFVHDGPIIPSTTLINRDCFRTVGGFDPTLLRAQDTEMWLRIIGEYPIHHVSEPLVLKRQREDSLGAGTKEKTRYLLQVIEKIVDLYPELAPLQHKRMAKIYSGAARNLAVSGERAEAVRSSLLAIRHDSYTLKHYATLLFSIIPIPHSCAKKLRRQNQKYKSYLKSLMRE